MQIAFDLEKVGKAGIPCFIVPQGVCVMLYRTLVRNLLRKMEEGDAERASRDRRKMRIR
jgi:hypothetical protein